MSTIPQLIVRRLAVLGLSRPTPQLITAIETRLAPRVAALIERSVTKTLAARAFASTLIEAQGSEEGSVAPTLPSSDLIVQQDKPNHVAGTTAADVANAEAL